MALTDAQLEIMHDDMIVQLPAEYAAGDDVAIAASYNELVANQGWRPVFTREQFSSAMDWTVMKNSTAQEILTLDFMFKEGFVDAGLDSVRDGFAKIFSGPAADDLRTALVEAAKDIMTRAELLFATGPDANSVYTLTFNGELSVRDASAARIWGL